MNTIYRSYSELIKFPSFEERFRYLSRDGIIGEPTFGGHRYLNQNFYQTEEWKRTRREIILRDNGCDLAHEGYPIFQNIFIHHINPITIEDIIEKRPCIFDLENLVCCSFKTHNAIHYGSEDISSKDPVIRRRNDTCPWR